MIATENEPSKAERARETWKEIGEGSDVEVSEYINLREGDLLETLKTDLPTVDLLLLDSELLALLLAWYPHVTVIRADPLSLGTPGAPHAQARPAALPQGLDRHH